jgi:phosphatidylserine/phosphatidylglycerophosphate/cardiolipin synthase-like enzyme
VWVTIAFHQEGFEMPGGHGSLFDVLDRAAARGIDVRALFWRHRDLARFRPGTHFAGTEEDLAFLGRRGARFLARWDQAHGRYCQHQKSWLIDAGFETETAILGGINLNPRSMASPGHDGEGQTHDVYIELAGPSVADVHHNFVQLWNEASERHAADGRWGAGGETDLPFPRDVPARRGGTLIQIQRTIHAGRYLNGHAAPAGTSFDIAAGERSNFDQYCAAIGAARRSIYMENQHLDVTEIVACLDRALKRGVEVVVVMPADPEYAADPNGSDERRAFLETRAALGAYENFTLAGLAGLGADRRRKPVYVHAKLMLVDDTWATVGSCNLHRYSLFGNSELNAAFRDPDAVRAIRSELFLEHLDLDSSGMDAREAHRAFRKVAQDNRRRLDAGDPAWQGLAFSLDLATFERGPCNLFVAREPLPACDKSV